MAEFIDVSELQEKMCEAKSNSKDSNGCTDANGFEKTVNISEEELAALLQEKLQLHEKGNEVKMIVSSILEKSREEIEKRDEQDRALENVENEKHVANLIRCRLLEIFDHCKKFLDIFERFLLNNRNELQIASGKSHVKAEQKLVLAESLFATFNEHVSTIDLLMKPDYDILCHEQLDCVNIVMRECDKVEESCDKLISLLYEKTLYGAEISP